jgi:sugar phosphate isomerase/epimerase
MTGQPELGLKWGFSTLGCPERSLEDVCVLGRTFNAAHLELRSLCDEVDLPGLSQAKHWTPVYARSLAQRTGTKFSVAGSSFKLVGHQSDERKTLADYCEWADSWGIPFVRIFGGGTWGQSLSDQDYDQACEFIGWWGAERASHDWAVELLVETHDAFSATRPCLELLKRLDKPIGLIWDSHHTWRLGGESPAETWATLGPWIQHVHIKDSLNKPSARHPYTYVLPGQGQMPIDATLKLLTEKKFNGVVSLEWERLWHPYLPPIEEAFRHLQKKFVVAAGFLGDFC